MNTWRKSMMKRTLFVAALALALAPAAEGQLYKYVDKNGKTVYSDTPPPGTDAKSVNVRGAGSGASQKTAVERDKEAEKGRKSAAENAKKANESSEKSAQAEQRCAAARSNYQMFQDGGRIVQMNDKGEREYLTDEQIEAQREKARRDMDEACKKS
jgi:hypothetical protein